MKDNTGLACLGLVMLAIIGIVVNSIINGWVLSILWSWFVSPLFGLPNLSIAGAIGFALVVGMLTKQQTTNNSDKETSELIAAIISNAVVVPLITLFIGWVISLYI